MGAPEFAKRRQEFLSTVGEQAIAIVYAAPETLRNGDAHYPFRQDSNFYYLTGFTEPEAVAVFAPGREEGEFILFNRPHDEEAARWVGPRAGQNGAVDVYGATQSFAFKEFSKRLPELMQGRECVYFTLGKYTKPDHQVINALKECRQKVRGGATIPKDILDCDNLISEMRLVKTDAEISLMQQAAEISANAHKRAMQICKPGLKEYALEAELLHEFYSHGSRFPAYPSIVGSGANACVLHYDSNQDELRNGDLVLIDAGAEYQYYAADITRTFPVNGKFSEEQRAIYELVLSAQLAGIDQVRPGTTWDQIQAVIVDVITEGLLSLGILKGEIKTLIKEKAYHEFYMHNSGHWLGMDVHDVGTYKIDGVWRALQAGMVLTVEPGIYIAGGNKEVDKKWWDIGIRIEDDVLVTEKGNEVLSADIPKTIDEIEALMKNG